MQKLALTIKLLYKLLVIGLFCIFANANQVNAAESSLRVMQNAILKGNLIMRFQADSIFTDKVIKFLDRGFTIRVEYTIELWQTKGYWFDQLDNQQEISYQIDFNPLEKKYVCKRTYQKSSIVIKTDKDIEKIIRWVMFPDFPVKITSINQLEASKIYYYNIGVLVATLTSENVKDLQKWISKYDEQEESSSLAKTAFKFISDLISSRSHKKFFVKSEQFNLSELPKIGK